MWYIYNRSIECSDFLLKIQFVKINYFAFWSSDNEKDNLSLSRSDDSKSTVSFSLSAKAQEYTHLWIYFNVPYRP